MINLLACLLVPLLLLLSCSRWHTCDAANLYVDASGPSDSTQTGTEEQPCLSISVCMNAAKDGDTVNVLPGDYTGPDNEGVCVSPLGRPRNCTATGVTLTGKGAPEDIKWYMSHSAYAQRALAVTDNSITTLANMTIAGFYYHPKFSNEVTDIRAAGGAVVVENSTMHMIHMIFANNSAATGGCMGISQGHVTITSSLFRDNQALVSGGALMVDGGSLLVEDSHFLRNIATGNPATQSFGNGGAIDVRGISKNIYQFVRGSFENNTAAQAGGAMHVASLNFKDLSLEVNGTVFTGNTATGEGSCVSSSACNVRGGAIFASAPSSTFTNVIFRNNQASSVVANQLAEGGAVYSTDVNSVNQLALQTTFHECIFEDNKANGYGGAAYVLNQYSVMTNSQFRRNSAGVRTELFADSSNAGGALWFSALATSTMIMSSAFEDNYVWGGWGGAVFVTDSPSEFLIKSCNFTSNNAFSSYTFAAQGGALMVSHNTIIHIDHSLFTNNTATPRVDIGTGPLTLSGSGGAIYGQSANLSISHSVFRNNLVLTGQFDSGSSGGAVLLEDSINSIISTCEFYDNGAAGYLGFSSFASSGTAGAIMLKFSSAAIEHCYFGKNWVSVGGTRLSSGGAVGIYFGYSSNGVPMGPGIIIKHSTFDQNTAFSSICAATGSKSGSGGAISVIGSNDPGVNLRNLTFMRNAAVSRSGLLVLSYGGAASISVGSNVTGRALTFLGNYAVNGLGNDISVLGGDTTSSNNNVNIVDSTFNTSLSPFEILRIKSRLTFEASGLCEELTQILHGSSLYRNKILLPMDKTQLLSTRKSMKHAHNTAAHVIRKVQHQHRVFQTRHKAGTADSRRLEERYSAELAAESRRAEEEEKEKEKEHRKLAAVGSSVGQGLESGGLPSFYHYPSILVVTGRVVFLNPHFSGEYHVFFGDFLELLLENEVSSRSGCQAFIRGDIVQQRLAITAFRAEVNIFDQKRERLEFDKLMLINSTLKVSNHIDILGNSSVVDSEISRDVSIVNPFLSAARPRLAFYGDLFTGFDLLDFSAISNLNPFTVQKLLTFQPVVKLDGVAVEVMKTLELNIPRVNEVAGSQHSFLKLDFKNYAVLNITEKAVVQVLSMVHANTANLNDTAIINDGAIILEGYKHTFMQKFDPEPDHVYVDDDKEENDSKFGNQPSNSLSSILTVNGQFIQSPSGKLLVSLNRTRQNLPVVNLLSNETFLGEMLVNFIGRPDIEFYDTDVPSIWEIVSYNTRKQNPQGTVALESPFGLGFTKVTSTNTNTTGNVTVTTYVDSYQISSMSCHDSIPYSRGTESQQVANTQYPCFLCLSNTTCSYCQNGGCMDSSSKCISGGGVQFEGSCCLDNCNSPNGECVARDENTQFSCECNAFYTGPSCIELSNITIVVITLSGALFVVILIIVYNYRMSRGKKSQVLEELRQGLLYDNEGGGNQLDNINEAYIQSLQQGLILKDVSVKFNEIHIEKQVGEGSFGVVYKATFRGASVAVKRMRPVFTEITSKDIEEFNKEAYMMSRLRHPNIVLVMGISYVEPEVMQFPKKSRFGDVGDDEDDAVSSKQKPKTKIQMQKTVCIVTEFLEQGSLADILYGPQRLPADIWTYDLILTCALQAARGMLYLHSHTPPICHRDLKSSNLVVDDHWVVKVTDFGMSRIIPEKVIDLETGVRPNDGTPQAVEIAKSQQDRLNRLREREKQSASIDWEGRDSHGGSSHGSDWESGGSNPYSTGGSNSAGAAVILQDVMSTSTPINISQPNVRPRKDSNKNPGKDRNGQEMTSNLGTTAWCAPELLTSSSKARYSVKVDVYSFGMVLWELWERKRPYEELASRFDIMDAIRSGKRPIIGDACPPALRSLIQRCWQGDPTRRPMFQYIVRYLKDELARVKRSRERQASVGSSSMSMNGSFERMNSVGSGMGGNGNGKGSNNGFDPMGTMGALGGKLSSMMPWGRTQDIPEETPHVRFQSAPLTIPNDDDDRGPLYGQPDINYLAASPAMGGGAHFARFQPQQRGSPKIGNTPPVTSHVPSATSSPMHAGAAPGQRSQPVWRDKYVMKMSGWQPSQPDTGLPPAAHGGGGGSSVLSKSLENNSYLQRQAQIDEARGDEEEGSRYISRVEQSGTEDDALAGSPPVRGRMPSATDL